MVKYFKKLILPQLLDFEYTASPHKLRHTGATLAKEDKVSLEIISEALTHSDKEITKTYNNTNDPVNQTVGDIAFRSKKMMV